MGATLRHTARYLDVRWTDNYTQEIFGNQFTVIDRMERLPVRLPKLSVSLLK